MKLTCVYCKKEFDRKGKKRGRFCSKDCQRRGWYHGAGHERSIARNRAWRNANPAKYKAIRRESDAKNREKINAYAREWRRKNGHTGVCTICESDTRLVYDHCHETGRHRGYICRKCNSILGFANDNPRILMNAIVYLTQT